MRVFIAYGDSADLASAFRLQALAEAKGLTVYLPSAHTRIETPFVPDPDVDEALMKSQAVWAIADNGLSDAFLHEIKTGRIFSKHLFVMSSAAFMEKLRGDFDAKLYLIEPFSQSVTEREIADFLGLIYKRQLYLGVAACIVLVVAGLFGLARIFL